MGTALIQQQQYAEAIGYLHKAIELQPDSAWAHYAMGLSLMKTGDFKTSAVHLEIASGRLPGLSALHSMLAEVYEHLGRSSEAARERASSSQGEKKEKQLTADDGDSRTGSACSRQPESSSISIGNRP